jgi:hypothetical protein
MKIGCSGGLNFAPLKELKERGCVLCIPLVSGSSLANVGFWCGAKYDKNKYEQFVYGDIGLFEVRSHIFNLPSSYEICVASF